MTRIDYGDDVLPARVKLTPPEDRLRQAVDAIARRIAALQPGESLAVERLDDEQGFMLYLEGTVEVRAPR